MLLLTGSSDVGLGASPFITNAHVNHDGSTGNLQLEARWRNQSFYKFCYNIWPWLYTLPN